MGSIYDAFHLSRLDFSLDDLASLPTWQLALVFAHPLATPLHKERAELYFGRARERDRMSGLVIGSNEERAVKAERALRKEEGGETLLQRVKPEPGLEDEAPIASTNTRQPSPAPAPPPPAGTPPLEGRRWPPAVEPRNNPAPPPLPAYGPPLRYGGLASPPAPPPPPPPRHLEQESRHREATATAYGARAPSQAAEPRAGPLHSHAGHHPPPPPTHYLPLPPPNHDSLPLPDQRALVPSALLPSLTCLTYTIPSAKITTTLLRLFLLRPSRSYGPMPIFISDPYSFAATPHEVFFYVAYRTTEDALHAQRANDGKNLPSITPTGHLPLSVVISGPADRIADLNSTLRWEHVWPVAQRSYLAYGVIPPFEGVPPLQEKGVIVSDRYQAEARKVSEEIRIAEMLRIRDGGAPPTLIRPPANGSGIGAGGQGGGGGKQQKKQERKKRLRENQRAAQDNGQQQAETPNGGGGGHQFPYDPPQQQPDVSQHDEREREYSVAEDGFASTPIEQGHYDPGTPTRHEEEDNGQQEYREDTPLDDRLPFAFPFPSANGGGGKRARYI